MTTEEFYESQQKTIQDWRDLLGSSFFNLLIFKRLLGEDAQPVKEMEAQFAGYVEDAGAYIEYLQDNLDEISKEMEKNNA